MHKYVVQSTEQITPSTLLITLKSDDVGSPFAFQPGQYAVINFYRHHRPSVVRCFSIVSSPTEQGLLQFSMRTKGHYTKALSRLQRGDMVDVRGPFGGFVLDTQQNSHVVLLAGGIGITPFMSMVRFAAVTNAKTNIELIYSCQNQDDIPFVKELERLQIVNPNFHVTFMIGEGKVDKLRHQSVGLGRISPELIGKLKPQPSSETTFMICGPPPFMRAMTSMLKSKGVQKHNIKTEAFSQGPNHQTGKVLNWPLNMYILTAAGVAVGSFIVMVADMMKMLPPSSLFDKNNKITAEILTNSRQTDLDSLVNSLPENTANAPVSDSVTNALNALKAAADKKQTTTSSTPISSTQTTTKKTSQTTPKPAPRPPACTTTQSGITTC